MKNIRIGKDIVINVTNLKVGGVDYSPTSYTANVAVSSTFGITYILPTTYNASTKTLVGTLSGAKQLSEDMPIGNYAISVWLNYEKDGQTVIDWPAELNLVDFTSEESGDDSTVETVSVSGQILVGGQSVSPATESANGLMAKEDKIKLNKLNSTPGFDTLVTGTKLIKAEKTTGSNSLKINASNGIGAVVSLVDGEQTLSLYGVLTDGETMGMMSGEDKVKLDSLAPVFIPKLFVRNEVLYLLSPRNYFRSTDTVEVARYGNHNHSVTYYPKDSNGNLTVGSDGKVVKQRFRRRKKGWVRVGTDKLGINLSLSTAVNTPYRPNGNSMIKFTNYLKDSQGRDLKEVVVDLAENHGFNSLIGSKMGIRIIRDNWPITEWMPISIVDSGEKYVYSLWRGGIKM